MTQWKIGDRAEVIGDIARYNAGENLTVIDVDRHGRPVFDRDLVTDAGWPDAHEFFRSITAYETIQINGKLYNLVPVEA